MFKPSFPVAFQMPLDFKKPLSPFLFVSTVEPYLTATTLKTRKDILLNNGIFAPDFSLST